MGIIIWEVTLAKTCKIDNELDPPLTQMSSVHRWRIERTRMCRNLNSSVMACCN